MGKLIDEDDDLLADDGFDRGSGDQHSFGGVWTRIKLEALEKYLGAFNTALSKQCFTRIYIDAFAGTGRCDIKVDGEKTSIDGSARRALAANPAFHKFCFIELRPKKLAALNTLSAEYPGKTIEVIQNDANAALKTLCGQYQWRNERAVLFLDPFGMHVEWSTLEAIAKTGAIDVWYLFPYAGLYRQAAKNADALDGDKEASLTRVRVPGAPTENAAVGLLVALNAVGAPASPLLEEEGSTNLIGLMLHVLHPLRPHGPCFGPGLTAHDHPVNAGEIHLANVLQQRFD